MSTDPPPARRPWREALGGLTFRGRAFLAAGATATAFAAVAGQPTVVRAGLLAMVLPLVSAAALARGYGGQRLSMRRELAAPVLPVGSATEVALTIANTGRAPSGLVRLEEELPSVLGPRPRFVVGAVARGWRRRTTYPVRAGARGRYTIGPMHVEMRDPFGLVRLHRTFSSVATLLVTPRIEALPAVALAGGWAGAGDQRTRAFSAGGTEDHTVREYREGDDLRRVHWRTSARAGELMVRREEQPWQARVTLLLDDRATAHAGSGPASSFETAVSLTASLAEHLAGRGYAVRLVTPGTATPQAAAWHSHTAPRAAAALVEHLTVAQTSDEPALPSSWLGADEHGGGLLIAVLGGLGGLGEGDLTALRALRRHVDLAGAIALDTGAWGATGATADAAQALLLAAGWRAVVHGPGDAAAATWTTLARSLGARSGTAGAPR